MRARWFAPLAFLLLPAPVPAPAQPVAEGRQSVAPDSTEAWAMRYFAGTTLMTSFGETAALDPWKWAIALEAGSIPPLNDAQQQAGLGGSKQEDLNKSPVIGRLRVSLGLPGQWVAELGYTPPLEIDGARPRNIVAMAVGRRLLERDGFSLSVRALGQLGKVEGDITCPARLAGVTDPEINRFGCRGPSNDIFTTNYYGADATAAWSDGRWSGYLGAGIVRADLAVQVDAPLAGRIERTRVTSDADLAWFTLGTRYALAPQSSLAAEVLYVPLDVRRPPDFAVARDSLTSIRLQLRRVID
jgi:hypothetical protein